MKLDKLARALRQMQHDWSLDAVDLIILDEVDYRLRNKEPVNVMALLEESTAAGTSTIHARLKGLCAQGVLKKVGSDDDMRIKLLDKGANYDKVMEQLSLV